MKKYINYIFIIFVAMNITGCGAKSLKCVKVSDNDGLRLEQKYYLKFNKNSVKSIDLEFDVDSNGKSIDSVDGLLQSINDSFSTYYGNKGINYSTSEKSNGFIYNIKINFNKLSNDLKSKINIINYMNSYDMIRYDLEQKDFVCE